MYRTISSTLESNPAGSGASSAADASESEGGGGGVTVVLASSSCFTHNGATDVLLSVRRFHWGRGFPCWLFIFRFQSRRVQFDGWGGAPGSLGLLFFPPDLSFVPSDVKGDELRAFLSPLSPANHLSRSILSLFGEIVPILVAVVENNVVLRRDVEPPSSFRLQLGDHHHLFERSPGSAACRRRRRC
uniref:Uncharacterized protein n=1 Tax=Odontella aurita TaxID=265563 RepID=A0A6U6J294_9STRA|mmetsp:Transcript_54108/g.161967  ORF Transcript_54108/g.161967 Transcript_54108/m.161967 type:complete len:187 (+) Transcript_54108:1266-1826(+)